MTVFKSNRKENGVRPKKSLESRRHFLKKGLAGMAGISILPGLEKARPLRETEVTEKRSRIIYRRLGRIGVDVPLISFGCGATNNANLVQAGLDAGMIHLDTANSYDGGGNETMLGALLKGRPRESYVIATKLGVPQDMRTGLIPKNVTALELKSNLQKLMDDSLKRLQLDYVDILYLHGVGKPELVAEKMLKEVILEFKKQGKTRHLGVSVHRNEPAVIDATVDEKIFDAVLTAYNFRQPHREEVRKAIARAAGSGLGIVVMKMMAGVYWDRERQRPINVLAAMKWVLQDENVHTIIPGITTFDQLEQDWALMNDLSLSAQEKADLRLGDETGLTGMFCSQCGQCESQCRYRLDIPTLMRCYMYAHGYQRPAKAKRILLKLDPDSITCRECSECAVSCRMGFNVAEKIKDIHRVLDIPEEFLA
jgi:predicted aldo/keto reductase-like oxidoreductase